MQDSALPDRDGFMSDGGGAASASSSDVPADNAVSAAHASSAGAAPEPASAAPPATVYSTATVDEHVDSSGRRGDPTLPQTLDCNTHSIVQVPDDVLQAVLHHFPAPGYSCRSSSLAQKSFLHQWGSFDIKNEDRCEAKWWCKASAECRERGTSITIRNGHNSNINKHLKRAHNLIGQGYQKHGAISQGYQKQGAVAQGHQKQGVKKESAENGLFNAKTANIKKHLKRPRSLIGRRTQDEDGEHQSVKNGVSSVNMAANEAFGGSIAR